MSKKLEVDMTRGPIFKKIIVFSIPLICSNVLQILFNAADILVLGIFVSDGAVAAVGSTGALINLIVGLFVGLSVGANVMVSSYLGKNDSEKVQRTIGCSVLVSVLFGAALIFAGVFGAKTFLLWMDCDVNVIDMATKYLKIYFIGMPLMMLYNFCASILRAAGETLKPLIFLTIGGVLNVILNIFFILVLHKDVEGVAIATVVSQGFAAIMCLIVLIKGEGAVKLRRKYLRIYKSEFVEMIKIGVPSGLQGCLFSLSNVIIQSNVNSFGEVVMAGNSYAQQFESVVYQAMNGVSLAALSFVSQNYGAGKLDRIKRVVLECLITVTVVGAVLGGFVALFASGLVGLITKEPASIEVAAKRLAIVSGTYFLCGIMEIYAQALRGLGKSTTAMVISLFGSCVLRIVWIEILLGFFTDVYIIYWSYPVSWFITSAALIAVFYALLSKLKKKSAAEAQAAALPEGE